MSNIDKFDRSSTSDQVASETGPPACPEFPVPATDHSGATSAPAAGHAGQDTVSSTAATPAMVLMSLLDAVCLANQFALDWDEIDIAIAQDPRLIMRWAGTGFQVACTQGLRGLYDSAAEAILDMLSGTAVDDAQALTSQLLETLYARERLREQHHSFGRAFTDLTAELIASGSFAYRTPDETDLATGPIAAE